MGYSFFSQLLSIDCDLKDLKSDNCTPFCYGTYLGGNEYGQCGEEPSKDETGRPVRRDIVIPKRCAPQLTVRQVILQLISLHVPQVFMLFFQSNPYFLGL